MARSKAAGDANAGGDAKVRLALLHAAIQAFPDPVYVKDTEGRFVLANEALAHALGRPVDAIIGSLDKDLLPKEVAQQVRFNDMAVMQSGQAATYEQDLELPGGQRRVLLAVKSPLWVEDQIAGVVGVSHDITDRKWSETTTRNSEARFRALLEASPDAVQITDATGRILLVNERTEKLFGYSRLELVGQPVEKLAPKEMHEAIARHRATFLQSPNSGELRMGKGLRRDGTVFDVEVNLGLAQTDEGPVMVTIYRDVTELRRLRQAILEREAEARAAQEATRLKDAFLSTLSHEMRTPLTLILGYTELLQDKYPREHLLDGVMDGAHRLMRHVEDLLDYSALVGGSMPLYRGEVCLPEIVRDALTSLEPEIAGKRQHLDLALDDGAPCPIGDARRISQVVQILLCNACRFTPPGGTIRVRLAEADSAVELSVEDNGPGMSEAEISRAFEPFGRGAEKGPGLVGGLGLGLKIARALVELHGGTLTLLSRQGQGTRAIVALPTSESGKRAFNAS